ncbi:peptidase [Kiloniella spongiae]|uniref:Peptidase n=1 Tax=Kiloniella spongiae TaxID=1489064 RepID=A0A0H2MIB3_9PROT|nr:M23 family metallopeptidase [Kiloniella spongiae]KLN62334.1 peptidase [Kiloniella spongiae]
MKRLFVFLFVIFGMVSAAFAEENVSLRGEFIQGGIIIGKVPSGTKVFLNKEAIKVSEQGDFVFGFGRDAEGSVELSVHAPNGDTQIENYEIKKRDYAIQRIEGVAQKYVSPPKEVANRISRDATDVAKARTSNFDEPMYASGFIWPAQGRISGVYGSQRVFNGVPKRPHFGVDVAAPVGTPITAPAPGIVTLAEPDLYYSGGTVILDHGHGLSSTFLHMNSVTVRVGDFLDQGDQLGTLGATGRVTGPHLDWRMNWFKERVDPETLVGPMLQ